MKWLIPALLISTAALAKAPLHRPPSFPHQGSQAVFVDFESASYDITYNITEKRAVVKALMQLQLPEPGHVVFDLINDPTSVKVDGAPVQARAIRTPNNETTVRVLDTALPVGPHTLEIEVPLSTLVSYVDGGVKSAFWVTDLEDRFYLERFIPTNLEYDNIKMDFTVNYVGRTLPHHVFANGNVTPVSDNQVKIVFPDYFTVNSLYFHTTPTNAVEVINFKFNSIDGRELPVTIYAAPGFEASELGSFKTQTLRVLAELEQDYGAFRHNSVTIFNASLASMGLGGMEYAGATVTDLSSLSHELFHSYFARGMTPANGNAGWIDEALASWRDDGYDRLATLQGTSRMAARPLYTRKTDTAAYSFGARFMAFLNDKFNAKGGLRPFMNSLLEEKLFVPITTEDFIGAMERFYSEPVQGIFNRYVYNNATKVTKGAHPVHRKLGLKELEKLLNQ